LREFLLMKELMEMLRCLSPLFVRMVETFQLMPAQSNMGVGASIPYQQTRRL